MQGESSQLPRERIAPNLYRRQTKGGGVVFEAVFRDTDGRQRRRTLKATTERAALREARSLLTSRDEGERIVAADLTLDQLADRDYWPMLDGLAAAGRRSQRGVDLYRSHWRLYVQPDLGSLRLSQVDVARVSALLRSLRARGYSESTIYSSLLVLRALYRLAVRRGLTSHSPLDALDPAELPRPKRGGAGRVLNEMELASFVRHAPDYYRAVVTVLAYTGLRISEVLGLCWRDIDFVDAELHVRGQLARATKMHPARIVAPKTNASERVVPMWPAVERALVELLAVEQAAGRGRDRDFVFVTGRGNPLDHHNVSQRGVKVAARAAGLGHVAPHDLRRSFCSLAARRGVDPAAAAELTGHSLAVWATSYARSFGKPQRDEARAKLLGFGFGAVDDEA